MNFKKIGFIFLGVAFTICVGILINPAFAADCAPAITGCNQGSECPKYICSCDVVPTSLPNEGGCGDPFYETAGTGCGVCKFIVGGIPCGLRCGTPKALESEYCYP